MAITISGQNNNDKILASDGVLDSISGFNVVGVMTAGQFDVTGKTTTNHISIGNNIHLGNAGIITATTLLANVTGNINHSSNLLLQVGGSEKFRVSSAGQLGIGGANYGSAGQVLTSGGSGSAATWSTIASDKIQEGNTFAEVIDTGSNGHFTVSTEGSERLRVSADGNLTVGAAVTISPVGNINATGIVTATSFSGSGANLTSLPAQATISNNADNRIITGGSGVNLNGEANLTFSGSVLNINGTSDDTPLMLDTTSNNGAHLRFRKDGSNQHFIGAGGGFSLGDKEDLSLRAYDNLLFATGNSSTEKVRISQTGSLGIGTAAPQVQTHIFGADAELLIERGGYSEAELWLGFPSGQPFIASGPGKGLKLGGNGKWNEGILITSTGEVKQYGFTGSTDTAVDDLVIGNTDSGTNRGMTIWSHNNQNGGIAFADNDSNFRGAIQYQHAQDRLRFIAEGEEVGMWSNQRGLMVGPTSTGDSVTSKGGAKLYHLCGATPLNGTYNSSTETPLMRCGHSFNGIFQMWMVFNGDEFHKGCRQEIIMCQGTYGYVSNSVRREHNQNALGAGLNSMDFAYQNSGSPNYYFKVTATWASGQNQPYILWSWTGHNSEYPYAL